MTRANDTEAVEPDEEGGRETLFTKLARKAPLFNNDPAEFYWFAWCMFACIVLWMFAVNRRLSAIEWDVHMTKRHAEQAQSREWSEIAEQRIREDERMRLGIPPAGVPRQFIGAFRGPVAA